MGGSKFNLEHEVKKYVNDVAEGVPYLPSADTLMHGLGSQIGPFDISGSISMGNLLPITDQLDKSGDFKDKLANTIVAGGGAVIGIPINIMNAVVSDEPNTWRRWEKAMPVQAKNLSKSLRWMVQGEEQDAGGKTVKKFDPASMNDKIIIGGQALGFTPSALKKTSEAKYLASDSVKYYQSRVQNLLAELYYHHNLGDREAVREQIEKIKKFNREAPRGISIDMTTIKESLYQRRKSQEMLRRGIYPQKKYRKLYEEVYENYAPEDED
jgi:hypothetical protein